MSGFISFLIGLASIALMVTVHEAGHFFGARLSGITIETFAIGWGKAIKTWRKNGIEYRINAFPLGGYCKLKGAEDLIASHERHEKEFSHVSSGSLFAAHPLKRVATYAAGPLMNLLFAVIIFIPFFLLPYTAFSDPATIIVTSDYTELYGVSENASEQAGLMTGDTVTRIDNTEVSDFQDISQFMKSYRSTEPVSVLLLRDGEEKEFLVSPIHVDNRYLLGISSAQSPVIHSVDPISPEALAGLREGDTVLSMNGEKTRFIADVLTSYLLTQGRTTIEVQHAGGRVETLSFIPERSGDGNIIAHLTFARNEKTVSGLSLPEAIGSALKETALMIQETLALFGQLITGQMNAGESLAGPLRISYVIGATFMNSIRSFLQLLAMVSISLGIANLLPLPALDGGSIVLSLIEWARKKRLPVGIYMKYQSVGLVILSVLILFVLYSDARFFFSG